MSSPDTMPTGSWPWVRGWRVERRAAPTNLGAYRLLAMLLSLVVGAFAIQGLVGGGEDIAGRVWLATFGSAVGINNTLKLAGPLILLGLAVAIPYRMKLWNIGAEGQLYAGAWAGAAVGFWGDGLSGPALIFAVLVASALGGAVWILVPALLRAYLGVREIITTLMLNFVALLWAAYWLTGPWVPDQYPGGVLASEPLPQQSALPQITLGPISFHLGLVIALVLVLILALVFQRTAIGYEFRVLGGSEPAARYAGIPVRGRVILAMLLAGAFAGLAGAIEMLGNHGRYTTAISNNSGYMAIAIAVLAGGSFGGVVFFSVAFASLTTAGLALRLVGISSSAVFALVGLILLLAAAGEGLSRYRVVRRGTP